MEKSFEEIQEIRKEVKERYPEIEFPDVVLEPIWYGRRPDTRIPDRFAIIDQENDYFYNICTDIYKPVYHEEVINLVENVVKTMPEFGKSEIKVETLANGGKLKVNVKFTEIFHEVRPGDSVNPQIDIKSSYDLGWKYSCLFGAYRLVCSNGATVGQVFERFKKRHLVSLVPEQLMDTIKVGMEKFSDQIGLWKNWSEMKVLDTDYNTIWEELPFTEAEKAKMEILPEASTRLLLPEALKSKELTVWDMFNVVTQFTTHEVASVLRQVELGPKITKVFENKFGIK